MLPTIHKECAQFLKESNGFPLLKYLPKEGEGYRRVKVRKKKNIDDAVVQTFNETFKDYTDLIQRAIFAYGIVGIDDISPEEDQELFYIFPVDGYRYMYAENVTNTTVIYKDTLGTLVDTYGEKGVETFMQVLKFQYKFNDLLTALATPTEIIFYGTSYYYAVRYSLIGNYEEFVK